MVSWTAPGYTGKIPDEQLKKQLAARPTVYLLGEIDILPLGGFDSLLLRDGARSDPPRPRPGLRQIRQ